MHRALQLDDIIRVVFDYVNELSVHYWPGGNVGQKTLAALARTCKIFHEPALDILWGDLYFPHPLIRCFSTRRNHFDSWGEHVSLSKQSSMLDADSWI